MATFRKRNGRWQTQVRIKLLKQHLGHFSLAALNSIHLAEYRDMQLSKVSPQTVKHELSLINRVLVTAQMDWGIHLPHGIPTVRKPTIPRGRDRRLLDGEEKHLLTSLSHNLTNAISHRNSYGNSHAAW